MGMIEMVTFFRGERREARGERREARGERREVRGERHWGKQWVKRADLKLEEK